MRPLYTANFCEKNLLEHFVIHLSVLSLLSDSGEMSDLWIKQLQWRYAYFLHFYDMIWYRIRMLWYAISMLCYEIFKMI